jgi:hypothetical protein
MWIGLCDFFGIRCPRQTLERSAKFKWGKTMAAIAFILGIFMVMYWLSWWAKDRAFTAWTLTIGVLLLMAILLDVRELATIAGVLLLLTLVGHRPRRKSRKERRADSSEDYSSNRYSESYEEAVGTQKWMYW